MKRVTAMTGVFAPLGRQVFLQRGHVQKEYYGAATKELDRMRRTYSAGGLTAARLDSAMGDSQSSATTTIASEFQTTMNYYLNYCK
jgi:glycerol kinase